MRQIKSNYKELSKKKKRKKKKERKYVQREKSDNSLDDDFFYKSHFLNFSSAILHVFFCTSNFYGFHIFFRSFIVLCLILAYFFLSSVLRGFTEELFL